MRILVIDVGGSHVKFRIWGQRTTSRFDSGKHLTAKKMCEKVLTVARDWKFDAVSIGFPGPVIHGKPAVDPSTLGKGWMELDYDKTFRKRVKIINDSAMQALGSYQGGRMLFIGLGTGVGSSLILDNVIVPLELGELRYSASRTVAEMLGKQGLKTLGVPRWERVVHEIMPRLVASFRADYVVIGGGNAKRLKRLPPHARRGSNERAFLGGARLWDVGALHAKPRKHTWVLT